MKQLFPSIPDEAKLYGRAGKFSVDLDIFGPSNAPRLNLQRKIVKFGAYKNWRLNGEFVDNPIDHPGRFNTLAEGDFAIFEFEGVHFPESVRLVLVAKVGSPNIYAACENFLGARKMATLSGEDLDRIVATDRADIFPIVGSSIDEALEDAALGGLTGIRKLQKRAATRPITKEEIRAARVQADDIGTAGEVFVNDYLSTRLADEEITSFKWVSLENAVSPFDFTVDEPSGRTMLDVKATKGDFRNRVHISINELLHMRDMEQVYQIYRVYNMTESSAKVRISENMNTFASTVIPILEALPMGVDSDGISVDPNILFFGPEITIFLKEEED